MVHIFHAASCCPASNEAQRAAAIHELQQEREKLKAEAAQVGGWASEAADVGINSAVTIIW